MTNEPTVRGGIEGYPTGLSWDQHHRVARVVASASTDAADCALLLAALGVHPADGLRASRIAGLAGEPADAVGPALADTERGIRRKRKSAKWTRD